MKHVSKLLGAAGTAALLSLVANPAYAAGTAAGTTITNTATVNFQVSGVTQTAASAANAIIVDAKIVLTATETGATTTVAPGQTGAVTTFQVTNSSNEVIDIGLAAAAQATGATTAHSGTDSVTATTFTYWVNTNGSATCSYSAANATQVTWLDEVPVGTTECLYVQANIPSTASNAQVAGINLTATAEQGGTSGSQGSVLTQSGSGVAWTPGTMQTVFADAAGNGGDANYDGKFTALADYTVSAPVLSVNKNSLVVSDPIEGSSNPKAIPGATLQYCIVVANASSAGTSATNISISDILPTTVTYKASSVVLNAVVSGSGNAATCGSGTAGNDTVNYSSSTGTVTGTLATLAPGASEGLSFQATIN
ncbi:hypothetical protein [Novosphingobium sp. FSW06-99]|uniref:hypothetical protein n=1 Tax=Novosphingobium sp. FSW06-99 TaxID=1739113 RepID=UPI00076C8C2F|nr:hypothetical protein [Novosphingobium sp. FSW06-99]KUR74681.1 hypothetical protein AQZ49_17460 [Novosphingobium sp. FSW06-99]